MTEKPTPNIDTKIYEVPVSALKAYGKNPRVGNIPAIAESLKINGQFRPIVVRRETQEILAGNHTWQAAKSLGWDSIKVSYVENIDDEQAKRIVLADNRYGDIGGYDNKILVELLESLPKLEGTGYDNAYLDILQAGLEPDAPLALTDEDAVPEVEEKSPSHIQPGEVWLLGPHRLICGDSTDADVYKKLLQGAEIDLVVTDPPYNVEYVGKTKEKLTIKNDSMNDSSFETFLSKSFDRMYESAKAGAPIYVFHADLKGEVFRRKYIESGFMLKQVLVWVKHVLVLSRSDYHWLHEPILYGWKPGHAHYWEGGRQQTTVFDTKPDFREMKKDDLLNFIENIYNKSTILRENKPGASREHPTMKPVALLKRLIDNSSPYQGKVLDPFGGSGSTLIASHALGRICYTIELDPHYADVIAKRYQEHSGILPVLESTGEPHDFTKPIPKSK